MSWISQLACASGQLCTILPRRRRQAFVKSFAASSELSPLVPKLAGSVDLPWPVEALGSRETHVAITDVEDDKDLLIDRAKFFSEIETK